MEVIYVAISRGVNVLAEYTRHTGNYETVTRLLLRKIGDGGARVAQIRYDEHIFHYQILDGITYLCMTDESAKSRLPFAFLADVADTFRAAYGERAQSAIAFEMNEAFAPLLRRKVDCYLHSDEADIMSSVRAKIEETKDVMVDNIDRILERGEKIELLVDKAEHMSQQAFRFERSAKSLKRAMCCKRAKIYAFGVFVLGLIVFFCTALACGPTFARCRKR
ncbi:synaptobrevin-domain-containing protein [Pelagophyceae sp. CCMP2097]|nr:synaptobrevin-domain-containing protein [Pelagophyceae sp. CCMP2097]